MSVAANETKAKRRVQLPVAVVVVVIVPVPGHVPFWRPLISRRIWSMDMCNPMYVYVSVGRRWNRSARNGWVSLAFWITVIIHSVLFVVILKDPIVRFLTEYDPLYPLVDDLGQDETTLYVNGPRRSLRPITRVILSSWEGWPKFRENWKQTNQQRFQAVGTQHLFLPDSQRYLTDRFMAANVGVPPTDQMIRISSTELLPALHAVFPLDTFQISLIPQAVRR